MFSFYLQTPAGFQIEFGHGARVVGDDWDDNRRTTASAPGVTSRCGSHERRRPSARRSTATSPSSAPGRRGSSSRSCSPSSAGPSSSSSSGPRRTRCRERCTSTTRSGASCSPAASARSCAPISEPAEVYEWRNAAGHDAAPLRAHRDGGVRLAVLVDVLPARARGAIEARAGSLPALEIRRGVAVDALEQHDDARRRRLRRRRPGPRPLRRRLRRRELDGARRCSASTSTTGASSTTG